MSSFIMNIFDKCRRNAITVYGRRNSARRRNSASHGLKRREIGTDIDPTCLMQKTQSIPFNAIQAKAKAIEQAWIADSNNKLLTTSSM